jgi:3-dehydrosphinganine reductase
MHPILGAILTGGVVYTAALLYAFYRYIIHKKNIQYKGKHIFITGGSTGLGEALAQKLFDQGANVTIVARNEDNLKKAQEKISKSKKGKIQYFSFDLSNPNIEDVDKLIDKAENSFGPIDFLVCNAGFSLPQMFLEADASFYEKQMNVNFLGYVKMSQPVAKRMAERRSGRIVYVSSILGTMTCAGYSPYSPSKHAIKALADVVEVELKPFNVNVHLYLPGTIETPGYEEENKMKPEVTKRIEGTADKVSAEQAATILLNGIARGDYIITTEMLFELTLPASIGSCRRNNLLYQVAIAPLSVLANYLIYFMNWKEMRGVKTFKKD